MKKQLIYCAVFLLFTSCLDIRDYLNKGAEIEGTTTESSSIDNLKAAVVLESNEPKVENVQNKEIIHHSKIQEVNTYNEEVLYDMTIAQLQLTRNEVYARKGYIFKKGGAMESYFSKQSWYTPKLENVDDLLSQEEKDFIKLIQNIESANTQFTVTQDNLRLRDSPSLDAIKVTNLPMGTIVRYLNEKSENRVEVQINDAPVLNYWYKVQTDIGEIGWIHGCCFQQL